jgi:phosphoglycerate dehydrogenase-like enzyme
MVLYSQAKMTRPCLLISSPRELFDSFFPARLRHRLQAFRWKRLDDREITGKFTSELKKAEALITTWESPRFSPDLPDLAPHLRMIAHCGGEVKARFARDLFARLTITNAPNPMSRPTAELGAALLLYSARNIDFYRDQLAKPSNRIYDDVHLHGSSESLNGQTVAMIGFGRIGRALVDLMAGFDLKWLIHDPYAPRSFAKNSPCNS